MKISAIVIHMVTRIRPVSGAKSVKKYGPILCLYFDR